MNLRQMCPKCLRRPVDQLLINVQLKTNRRWSNGFVLIQLKERRSRIDNNFFFASSRSICDRSICVLEMYFSSVFLFEKENKKTNKSFFENNSLLIFLFLLLLLLVFSLSFATIDKELC